MIKINGTEHPFGYELNMENELGAGFSARLRLKAASTLLLQEIIMASSDILNIIIDDYDLNLHMLGYIDSASAKHYKPTGVLGAFVFDWHIDIIIYEKKSGEDGE